MIARTTHHAPATRAVVFSCSNDSSHIGCLICCDDILVAIASLVEARNLVCSIIQLPAQKLQQKGLLLFCKQHPAIAPLVENKAEDTTSHIYCLQRVSCTLLRNSNMHGRHMGH